jgi:myosin heavy subunit
LSKREDEDYTKWLDEVKKAHPDVADKLDALAETEAGRELFRGNAKREPEFYRRLNDINEKEKLFNQEKEKFEALVEKHNSWYEGVVPAVDGLKARAAEADALQARLEAIQKQLKDTGVTVADIPNVPSRSTGEDITAKQLSDLQQRVKLMDEALPQILGKFLSVQHRAQKEGFDVDPQEVLATVYKDRVDPNVAYERMTQEAREKRANEKYAADLKAAREEGAREALSKLSGPDRLSPNSPSIVEALRADPKDQSAIFERRDRVDAAVKDFMELANSGA